MDNTELDAGSGGDVIGSDDISGIKYQRVKFIHGADGVNDGDVSTANPLPARVYFGTVAASVGAGAVGTGVQRFTLASDDLAVASLSIIDDWDDGSDRCRVAGAAAHDAAAAGNPVLLGAYAKAAAPTDVSADADAVRLWALLNGAQCIQVTAAGALIGGDATNGLDVDVTRLPITFNAGAVAATTPRVTLASDDPAVAALGDLALESGGNLDAITGLLVTQAGYLDGVETSLAMRALESGGNLAAAATSLAVIDDWDESDRAKVNPIVGQAGVAAGAGAVSATVQRTTLASDDPAVTALQIMDDWDNGASDGASVSGDVAHDAADAGEPVKIGGKAVASPKGVTLVADADRTNAIFDLDGIQIVKLDTAGADIVSESISNTDGSETAFTNFGATASQKNAITSITAFRTDAGTTMAYIDIKDGSGGTVLWRIPLPAGGGYSIAPSRALFKSTANTALYYDASSALTTVYLSVSGFKTKV